MNLVQIQENLKDLPTQAIMAYANGKNPEVPPFMALSELNRRKSMEERSAQQPTQSVKDKLESQVGQAPQGPQMPQGPQGIAQLPGAQQGAPQGAPGAPQGIAQGAPQGMPQAAPPGQPVGMADGGLAGLPVSNEMFNYAPGGIVAFADGEIVPEEEDAGEAEAKARMADLTQGPPTPAPVGLEALSKAILARQVSGQTNIPAPMSPAEAKAEAIRQRPELAPILNALPGSAITSLIGKMGAQGEAEKAKFKESEGRMGLSGLSNALIAAGEATRGHKGMAFGEAMGGFGKSYGTYTAESVKREQAQQALERQHMVESAKLQSDVESLQRAYAEGDVNKIAAYKAAVADRQAKIETIQANAAKEGLDIGLKERTLEATKGHYAATEAQSKAQLEETKRMHGAQIGQMSEQQRHQRKMEDIAEATKPTADQKIDLQVQAKVNSDPTVRSLAKRLDGAELGSDDYYNILEKIREASIVHYPKGAALPAPIVRTPITKPPEEPGFFDRMFGSTPAKPASKPVSFSDLPE